MTLYRDCALVLRGWKLGESDRIVSMIGEGSGKIRAVVKGVRKTKSRFGARLEPLSVVSLLMWKGRELDVVSQAETIEFFRTTRQDLDRLAKANVILEVVEQLAQEQHPDPALYQLTVRALRVLEEDNPPMLLSSYVWKLLSQQGYRPQFDRCAICQIVDRLVGFDAGLGGVLCQDHTRGKVIRAETIEVIRMALDGQLVKVLSINDPQLVSESEVLAFNSLENILDRKLRTLNASVFHN